MKTTILFAIALWCPLAALTAQEMKPFDAKPGLWEYTTTTQISGMPAMPAMPQLTPDQLARIPEAQRKQVEAMMASRGGGSVNLAAFLMRRIGCLQILGDHIVRQPERC